MTWVGICEFFLCEFFLSNLDRNFLKVTWVGIFEGRNFRKVTWVGIFGVGIFGEFL